MSGYSAYQESQAKRPIWRRLLPSSLFGRALLIVMLPILLAQGTAAYLFYARHWDNVSRSFASSVAGEIGLITDDFAAAPAGRRNHLAPLAQQHLGIIVKWLPGGTPLRHLPPTALGDPLFDDVARQLEERLRFPFQLERVPGDTHVRIVVWLPDGELTFLMSKKRLSSPTIEVWFVGTALAVILVLFVAVLFLRNQIRPIVQLARAADRFGRGQDLPGFHPHGAREVRMAAHAFLTMRERLRRMLGSRTEMLAAISHDLRTPLTRMHLQLALLPENSENKETIQRLRTELGRMEAMIAEYLDFVRADGGEAPVRTSLHALIGELAEEYIQAGQQVELVLSAQDALLPLRPRAFRRALSNLIDNALRYGQHCLVTLDVSLSLVSIHVEDDGPGIAPAQREEAFLPFRRLDEARGSEGGAGLGLSIVREIVHAVGGRVQLGESSLSHGETHGLRASVVLPR